MERPWGDLAARAALAAAVAWSGRWTAATRRPTLAPEKEKALWEQSAEDMDKGRDRFRRERRALRAVRRLLRSYPDNHRYLEREAELYGRLGAFDKEAASWELFMRTAPFPGDACPKLGFAYRSSDRDERHLDAQLRCLALAPKEPDAMFFAGQALAGAGRTQEAERIYRDILARSPAYVDAQVGLAKIRALQDHLEEAEAILLEVFKAHPAYADALLVQAEIEKKRGHAARAKELLLLVIEKNTRYSDAYLMLAGILESEGDQKAAAMLCRRLLKVEPRNKQARARLKSIKGWRFWW